MENYCGINIITQMSAAFSSIIHVLQLFCRTVATLSGQFFFFFFVFFVSFSGFYSVFAATGLSVFVTYSNFPGGSSSVTAFHSLLSALKSRSRKRWRELEAFVSSGFLLGTFRHSITSTVPNPCS